MSNRPDLGLTSRYIRRALCCVVTQAAAPWILCISPCCMADRSPVSWPCPCRFPIGGDTVSVTSGVVSRIEVTTYTQSVSDLLGVQIDAAINSGNSGGPSFNSRGECVGVAFQSLRVDPQSAAAYACSQFVIAAQWGPIDILHGAKMLLFVYIAEWMPIGEECPLLFGHFGH